MHAIHAQNIPCTLVFTPATNNLKLVVIRISNNWNFLIGIIGLCETIPLNWYMQNFLNIC